MVFRHSEHCIFFFIVPFICRLLCASFFMSMTVCLVFWRSCVSVCRVQLLKLVLNQLHPIHWSVINIPHVILLQQGFHIGIIGIIGNLVTHIKMLSCKKSSFCITHSTTVDFLQCNPFSGISLHFIFHLFEHTLFPN